MKEQLKELLEMQRTLDHSILKVNNLVYDEEIASKIKIALFVELGEMMQELPTHFKFWKKNKTDNREKALEEYVDALSFALSLFSYFELDISKIDEYGEYDECCESIPFLKLLTMSVDTSSLEYGLMFLFTLGNHLGFTWDEIYKAYKDKKQVNFERLANGY